MHVNLWLNTSLQLTASIASSLFCRLARRLAVTLNTASDYRPLSDYRPTMSYYWTYRLLTVSVRWLPSVDSAYSAESTDGIMAHWLKVRRKQFSFNTSYYRPLSDYRTIGVLFRCTFSQCAIGQFSWISWIDRWHFWQSWHTDSQQPIRPIVQYSRPIVR